MWEVVVVGEKPYHADRSGLGDDGLRSRGRWSGRGEGSLRGVDAVTCLDAKTKGTISVIWVSDDRRGQASTKHPVGGVLPIDPSLDCRSGCP